MQAAESYVNERLDHLGIVAGACQEIGLADWLNEQDSTKRQVVSVGTATTAMLLNGLGFSNRQLYLVPQYFANKPVEHLLGRGITAEMLIAQYERDIAERGPVEITVREALPGNDEAEWKATFADWSRNTTCTAATDQKQARRTMTLSFA